MMLVPHISSYVPDIWEFSSLFKFIFNISHCNEKLQNFSKMLVLQTIRYHWQHFLQKWRRIYEHAWCELNSHAWCELKFRISSSTVLYQFGWNQYHFTDIYSFLFRNNTFFNPFKNGDKLELWAVVKIHIIVYKILKTSWGIKFSSKNLNLKWFELVKVG